MPLYLHEAIHFSLSALTGYIAIRSLPRKVKRTPSVISGIFLFAFLGGFFIDLDHLFEYFLAFGTNFRFDYFLTGMQFLELGKAYVLFHAWEYIPLLLFFRYKIQKSSLKKKDIVAAIILALTLGMTSHLVFDQLDNNVNKGGYFLIYRFLHNFNLSDFIYWE